MLLLLVWMRKRIQLAIGIIKEATKAIATMPSIIAFPGSLHLTLLHHIFNSNNETNLSLDITGDFLKLNGLQVEFSFFHFILNSSHPNYHSHSLQEASS
jgi:hypothetical protein